VLELLLEKGFSASVLTKSDLAVRDIDIFSKMDNASNSISAAFNDNRTRSLFEDNTVDTEKRIAALGRFKEAGVRTGALLCPVIPNVTDAIDLVERLEPYTDVIWIYGLSFKERTGKNWGNVQKILKEHLTDSAEQIEAAVFSREDAYWGQLRAKLEAVRQDRGVALNIRI
jgi:DNA repair photolyase